MGITFPSAPATQLQPKNKLMSDTIENLIRDLSDLHEAARISGIRFAHIGKLEARLKEVSDARDSVVAQRDQLFSEKADWEGLFASLKNEMEIERKRANSMTTEAQQWQDKARQLEESMILMQEGMFNTEITRLKTELEVYKDLNKNQKHTIVNMQTERDLLVTQVAQKTKQFEDARSGFYRLQDENVALRLRIKRLEQENF